MIFKLVFERFKKEWFISLTMLLGLTTVFFFPIFSNMFSRLLSGQLMQRAESVPLLITARGSRFLAVLNTLYYYSESDDFINLEEEEKIKTSGKYKTIPVYNKYKTTIDLGEEYHDFPIIGTTLDYFDFRQLQPATGELFYFPGETIIGHNIAKRSGLKPGDYILSSSENLFNLNSSYPLKLKITGILPKTGTRDDSVVFTDLKSIWVMDGFFHGHTNAENAPSQYILQKENNTTIFKKNLIEYNEISSNNINDFHFHGSKKSLPISGILVIPDNYKDSVILNGIINSGKLLQALQPEKVMQELFSLVFSINQIFNKFYMLFLIAAAAFLSIIIFLSLKLRENEFITIKKIGGSRLFILKLFSAEYSILLSGGFIFACCFALIAISILKKLII